MTLKIFFIAYLALAVIVNAIMIILINRTSTHKICPICNNEFLEKPNEAKEFCETCTQNNRFEI
jgi:hypothetical protein